MSNTTTVQYLSRFYLKQRITMLVNRYEVIEANPDGSEGRLLAVAQQKRITLREQVTFYEDEAKTRPAFSFRAQQVMELAALYNVTTTDGRVLGSFQKNFGASLMRSSFDLTTPHVEAGGQERNAVVAVIRRLVDFPFLFHFDFTDRATGQPVLSSERQLRVRDRYLIDVPDERIDYRVAACVAVGLDTLLQR